MQLCLLFTGRISIPPCWTLPLRTCVLCSHKPLTANWSKVPAVSEPIMPWSLHGRTWHPTQAARRWVSDGIIEVTWQCHKPFSQRQRSFPMKAVLPLAKRFVATWKLCHDWLKCLRCFSRKPRIALKNVASLLPHHHPPPPTPLWTCVLYSYSFVD